MKTICRNGNCAVDYPHFHQKRDGQPEGWMPTIDDPAVRAPWPDRLHWQRPQRSRHDDNFSLFKFGWFASHSKFQLPFKIDLESGLGGSDWDSITEIIAWKFAFRSAYGIPKGGERLARALDKYCDPGYPIIIVDDVLTTGKSMQEARARLNLLDEPVIGVVVVARGPVPNWVFPILTVNEFFQSRATGLG